MVRLLNSLSIQLFHALRSFSFVLVKRRGTPLRQISFSEAGLKGQVSPVGNGISASNLLIELVDSVVDGRHIDMVKMIFAFLLAAFVSLSAAEPVTSASVNSFTAVDCLVTRVSVSEGSLFIEFQGRWKADALQATFADTDRNGVAFLRETGGEQEWSKAVKVAEEALNKKATIKVKSAVWMMRGGIPMFRVPPATIEITVEKSRVGKK